MGRTGPQGVLGGGDGGVNKVRVNRNGQAHVPPHLSKEQDLRIGAGDRVRVSTPGGGGYGDPLDRNPELVLRDLERGYYTVDQAAELFGVVVGSGTVDALATETLRDQRRGTAHAAE